MSTGLPETRSWRWYPTRAEGLQQLRAYAESGVSQYSATRNLDQGFGQHQGVSRLSPWISHRALLESEVIEQVTQHPTNTQKFIQEIFWRGYWKGWLQHRPGMWGEYQQAVNSALRALETDSDAHGHYRQATEGQTQIALFNNWVEELCTTGYLHNHARMWFASIWIFSLRLPWQLGADFFYRHLLDGDAAVNTLSWRWVAGLHTKGKVYAATRENILRNAESRATRYSEGLEKLVENPQALPEEPQWSTQALSLELPIDTDLLAPVDLLLVHEDDLGYGLSVKAQRIVALSPQPRSRLATAHQAVAFSQGLLTESVASHSANSSNNHQNSTNTACYTPSEVLAFALRNGVRRVVTPFAPAGPTNDALDQLASALQEHHIELNRVVRSYDRLVWPHTKKGFFALNKKIPDLLIDLH